MKPVADDAQIIRAALAAIISRVSLVSPYYEVARDAEVALDRIVREREMAYEALKAWEHWYSVESTEFTRDTAREAGLKVIAKVESLMKEDANHATIPPETVGADAETKGATTQRTNQDAVAPVETKEGMK